MGVFFITWQLWEEMTFVLACAIVAVFGVGLFKLWRTSRQVRRQEVLDEEKRARLTEMRKVSLTAKKKKNRSADIPFGVRAIQTGVEVDGIWISRPTTPTSKIENTQKNIAEGKRLLGDYQPYASSPLADTHDTHDTHSNTSTPLPQISEHAANTLNEDALQRLEGTYSPTGVAANNTANTLRPPFLNTYIPSSRMSSPSPSVNVNANATQRPHEVSTRFIGLGQPGPSTNSDSNSSTSSRQPQPVPATATASTAYTSYRGYQTQPVASHYSAPPSFSPSPAPVAGAFAGIPGRTARRVNSSFEVLPAGTFAGREETLQANQDKKEESAEGAPPAKAAPPARNKLRRSNGPIR